MSGIVNPAQIKYQLKQIGRKLFIGYLVKITRFFKSSLNLRDSKPYAEVPLIAPVNERQEL